MVPVINDEKHSLRHSVKTPSEIIWWERIGKSVRMIHDIKLFLANQKSFILSAPQGFPWQNAFEKVVKREVSTISSERLLRYIYPGTADPDRYCLSELCSDSFESAYWPSMSRTAYLCTDKDILFHRYYIWVKGIEDTQTLKKWISFISEYSKEVDRAGFSLSASFVLEFKGIVKKATDFPVLNYVISDLDCRIFGLEILQEQIDIGFNHTDNEIIFLNSEYLSGMAAEISNNNPELSDVLLETPESFLANPVRVAMAVSEIKEASEQHIIESAIWKAQIMHFFPLLEQCRLKIIEIHAEEIAARLPIKDIYGEVIKDPEDMEFRHLITFGFQGYISDFKNDKDKLILCRNMRNALSHNSLLDYATIAKFMKYYYNE